MANRKDGRAVLTIGKGSAAVLSGQDDISTWDDEELAMGRRRDKNGYFTGKPPRMIPVTCVQELNRRKLFESESVIRNAVVESAAYIANVMRGREEPSSARQRAAETLIERFMGKPRESVSVHMSVAAQVEELPWVQALRKAGRVTDGRPTIDTTATRSDGDIVDAEVIEDNPLCACGCGQPPRSGSAYLNGTHQRHAESKAQRHPDPSPTWSESEPVRDDDPILWDDDGDFVEETDDDPVLW